MDKLRETARQLLDEIDTSNPPTVREKTITAMREALAEPKRYNHETGSTLVLEQAEQEPVAYVLWGDNNVPSLQWEKPNDGVFNELYYAAPVRTKDLTDDEIYIAVGSAGFGASLIAGCRAVIAADREKNK